MTTIFSPYDLGSKRADLDVLRRPGVLLAVGELTVRLDLASHLSRTGFEVWTAGTGLDALVMYMEHRSVVAVLVIDADLRDLPGLAFLRRLRAHFPAVPCVFLLDPDGRALDLIAAGAIVLSRDSAEDELSNRLWEVVADVELELE